MPSQWPCYDPDRDSLLRIVAVPHRVTRKAFSRVQALAEWAISRRLLLRKCISCGHGTQQVNRAAPQLRFGAATGPGYGGGITRIFAILCLTPSPLGRTPRPAIGSRSAVQAGANDTIHSSLVSSPSMPVTWVQLLPLKIFETWLWLTGKSRAMLV